ncbi:MAG TPA: ABC transporter permease [Rubrivivax sp.]|nr:ABC transporter permease [Rubrivivax sp.]
MKALWNRSWPALLLLGAILLVWELAARAAGNPNVPPLSVVLQSLVDHDAAIAVAILQTLRRALIGLLIAIVTMIPLGILIGRIRWLGDLLEPVIDLLRPLPPPAVIPLVMLFAGIGDAAKIAVIVYTASFPILIHAIDGIRGTHPLLHTVSRAFRLRRAEAFWNVDLPATLPLVMTGLRLASAYAFLVAVTAEMLLSTDGIGVFLLRSQETFRIADGLAAICVIAAVGWCINAILLQLDRRLLHWHYATTAD